MALAYLIMYAVIYGLPLLGSLCLIFVLGKLVFRGKSWAWPVSIGLVLIASCIPWALDQLQLRQEIAAYVPDTIWPERLDIEPGALWHIEEGNHAGVTCGYGCDFTELPFVTEVRDEDVGYALQLGSGAGALDQHNLWDGLYDVTPESGQPFPYRYAYIGLSQYQDHGAPQSGNYRKPHWPETGKGVHMLVRLPTDGLLDFATAEVLYRRYNIQREMALPFFWGVATQTVQAPSAKSILQDLQDIARG